MKRLLILALMLFAAGAASAHEGHDQAAAPEAPRGAPGPRAEGATPDFEVVAVLQGGQLVVYLDRYANNEPVAGARVEVDSDAFGAEATPASDGVYVIERVPFTAPGTYPLVFTVRAGGAADLLHGLLEVPAPAPGSLHPTESARSRTILASTGVVLFAAAGWVWSRRLRKPPGA